MVSQQLVHCRCLPNLRAVLKAVTLLPRYVACIGQDEPKAAFLPSILLEKHEKILKTTSDLLSWEASQLALRSEAT